MMRLPCCLLLLSCRLEPRQPAADGPFHDGDPAITGLRLACDQAGARWMLKAETDAWTGGGVLYMTLDGEAIERHLVYSEKADASGGWDCLSATLDLVADPMDAAPGSSTRFLCREAEGLSFLFVVLGPRDEEPADCRAWGADPGTWEGIEGVPACDDLTTWEDTGGATTGGVEDGFASCR